VMTLLRAGATGKIHPLPPDEPPRSERSSKRAALPCLRPQSINTPRRPELQSRRKPAVDPVVLLSLAYSPCAHLGKIFTLRPGSPIRLEQPAR
jgi:hypothetical protein